MRAIAKRTLRQFWTDHRDAEASLVVWHDAVSEAKWASMSDITGTLNSADPVGPERVVFNIGHNRYRLVAAIDFERQIVFVKWVGSHRDYNRIDPTTISFRQRTR